MKGTWPILPIFAIYIVQNIPGGDAQVVGIAAGIYFIVKAFAVIPIGRYLDNIKGEEDDFWFMFAGVLITGLVPLGYLAIQTPFHLYILQFVYALGAAMYAPTWGGIFTRHIDKDREASTWSVESAMLGLGMGVAGFIGGFIADKIGFAPLFVFVSLMNIMGGVGYLFIRDSLFQRGKTVIFPK